MSVATDTSREMWKDAGLIYASPPRGWPGEEPPENEVDWLNNEIDHNIGALNQAEAALSQSKHDIQVLWHAVNCLQQAIRSIDKKIGELIESNTNNQQTTIRELKKMRVTLIQKNSLILDLGQALSKENHMN